MLKVTFDLNCIISLEENDARASDLRKLIKLHDCGRIILRVPAASASERKPDDTYARCISEFTSRLVPLGLGDVEILCTILYLGLGFIGYAYFSGGKLDELERKIQEILFPKLDLEFDDFRKKHPELDDDKAWRRWANKKCDVLGMWSHIWHHGDIFVTSDERHFLKQAKKEKLEDIGAGRVFLPKNALSHIKEANNQSAL